MRKREIQDGRQRPYRYLRFIYLSLHLHYMTSFCMKICGNRIKEYHQAMNMIFQVLMMHAGRQNGPPLAENDQLVLVQLLFILATQI